MGKSAVLRSLTSCLPRWFRRLRKSSHPSFLHIKVSLLLAILRTFCRMMSLISQTSRYSWPYSTSRRRCSIRVPGNLGRSIETEISHRRRYVCSRFYIKLVLLLKLGQKSFDISKKPKGMGVCTRISSKRSVSTSGEP